MSLYIPPFWCGVIATIIAIIVGLIVYGVHIYRRDKKKEDRSNDK